MLRRSFSVRSHLSLASAWAKLLRPSMIPVHIGAHRTITPILATLALFSGVKLPRNSTQMLSICVPQRILLYLVEYLDASNKVVASDPTRRWQSSRLVANRANQIRRDVRSKRSSIRVLKRTWPEQ